MNGSGRANGPRADWILFLAIATIALLLMIVGR